MGKKIHVTCIGDKTEARRGSDRISWVVGENAKYRESKVHVYVVVEFVENEKEDTMDTKIHGVYSKRDRAQLHMGSLMERDVYGISYYSVLKFPVRDLWQVEVYEETK